jgi:hypothetical protein
MTTVKKLRRGTSKEARAIWKMVEEAAAQSPPWMRGHIKKIVTARFPTSQNTEASRDEGGAKS